MYYRIATRPDAASIWQWKSTVLSSLDALLQFLRSCHTLPHDHVFFAPSREGLAEQLARENKGLLSTSVTVAQFLQERLISPPAWWSTTERARAVPLQAASIARIGQQTLNEYGGRESILGSKGISVLEKRRQEMESGSGGDYDLPYSFSLPHSQSQALAWLTLLARVQRGELLP